MANKESPNTKEITQRKKKTRNHSKTIQRKSLENNNKTIRIKTTLHQKLLDQI